MSTARTTLSVVLDRKTELFRLTAKLSADRLKLFVDCRRTSDKLEQAVKRDELVNILKEIVSPEILHLGVLDDVVDKLNKHQPVIERRVAKGDPPLNGRNGKIVLLVKKYEGRTQNVEVIDPRFIRFFDNVEKGMVIGRVYPPTFGEDGKDVFGMPVSPLAGEPADLHIDESITLRPPAEGHLFHTLVANQAGYVSDEAKLLRIVNTLEISGDVDYRVGDIDFVGAVRINGSVMKGFTIIAREDIEVSGDVIDGMLISTNGSIRIQGKAVGSGLRVLSVSDHMPAESLSQLSQEPSAQIEAARSVRAGLLQDIVVQADSDIVIDRETNNAYLHTKRAVIMPTAALIGGQAYAVLGVEAQQIGTEAEAPTRIRLCSEIESSVEYLSLKGRIAEHWSGEEMIKLYLGPYAEDPARVRTLSGSHRTRVDQLLRKLATVRLSRAKLEEELQSLCARGKHSSALHVSFNRALCPGVSILADDKEYHCAERISGPKTVRFDAETKDFAVVEFAPVERAEEITEQHKR